MKNILHKDWNLARKISDKILEVANIYNEVTTSDLQGIADVEARKIIDLVRRKNEQKID